MLAFTADNQIFEWGDQVLEWEDKGDLTTPGHSLKRRGRDTICFHKRNLIYINCMKKVTQAASPTLSTDVTPTP
jgi:hypothetical protein